MAETELGISNIIALPMDEAMQERASLSNELEGRHNIHRKEYETEPKKTELTCSIKKSTIYQTAIWILLLYSVIVSTYTLQSLSNCRCSSSSSLFSDDAMKGGNSPTEPPTMTPTMQTITTCIPTAMLCPEMPTSQSSTLAPSFHPTATSTAVIPTALPSHSPSGHPSESPTGDPTQSPTLNPSSNPSNNPTSQPSESPSNAPTKEPTKSPSNNPSKQPTANPSLYPTKQPTRSPSNNPTKEPSLSPSIIPTISPSLIPSVTPISDPTKTPSAFPTLSPTSNPTSVPTTLTPTTSNPTTTPTTLTPTTTPTTSNPTIAPTTLTPTTNPITSNPSSTPTEMPSTAPISVSVFNVGDFKLSYLSSNHDSWLLCDGSYYDPAVYSELFSVIDYTFGKSGTSFRVPVPGDQALGIAGGSHPLGSSTGSETTYLSVTHIPSHYHYTVGDAFGTGFINSNTYLASRGCYSGDSAYDLCAAGTSPGHGRTSSTGSGSAFSVVQPISFPTNMFIYSG